MSLRDNRDKPYARPPLNRQGPGLVTLGAPKRTKSAAKLAVPKPVNLPSLKKENAGNDPTTQLVPSGHSGWTAAKAEESPERHGPGGASLVERSTWASGEGPRAPPLPQAAWQRTGPLNPQDFPSLAVSASGKPPLPQQHPRPPSDLAVPAGIWDEDERDYRHPVQRSALIDRGEPRDSSREHPGYGSGSSYREDRERGAHASRGDSGRHSPTDLGYGYDRGQYSRDGAPGYGVREGSYSRDRSEPPPYRDRDGSHGGREGPYHPEEGRSSRDHYSPRDRHGPGYGYGGPREPRYDNGGRWGGYEPRRYDDVGYREEYGRGYGGGYDSRQPNPRFERPSRPYQPAADYDPELFPPLPGEPPHRSGATGNRGAPLDRDEDREAFNAELERVAAELDTRQHQQQQSGHGEGSGSALAHKRRGSDQLERGYSSGEEQEHPTRASAWGDAQGSVAARAAAERRAAEEEESERREAAARKLREIESRMAERDEEAQRRARELAHAQAAAHAALSKPPPAGAEPAVERRPSAASLDRRPEPLLRPSPQVPAALPAVPPPPPPPRRAEGQSPQPAAHPAADAAEEEPRRPAAPPAMLPMSSPPPPPPVQAQVPQPSPLAQSQAEVPQSVALQPVVQAPVAEATAPSPISPARQPSPQQQEQQHELASVGAAEPSPAAVRQPPGVLTESPPTGKASQDARPALPPLPVAAAISPAQAAGAAAGKTSLVKPGASWRAMLTGVPDAPARPSSAAAQQAAVQRAAGVAGGREGKGAGRERDAKRAKGKVGKAAAAAGPVVAIAPPITAEAASAPAKGKGKGRGGKAQKAAIATTLSGELQQQPQPPPGQAQQAQQQRGNRRQQQQQQQQQQVQRGEGPAAAGGKSGRGAGRGRGRGKAGAAPPGQPAGQPFEPSPAASGSPASSLLPTAQQEPQQPAVAAEAAALPQLSTAGEGGSAATTGSGELPESSELPLAPALSAAAFGWSSPLADEVAKLQLSAAASAEAELAAEVAAAAAAAANVADMARESLPAAMMLEVGLGQELLDPSAGGVVGAMPAAATLDPMPAAGAALANAASSQANPHLPAAVVGTSSGLDLLADDVITALPADLSLDLAGGTAPPAIEPGVAPHSAFVLPPQAQHAASPPPFPGSYFPITSLPGAASNPWQLSAPSQEPSATSLAAAAQSLYSISQQGGPHFTFGTHTNIPIPGTTLGTSQFSQPQQQQQHPQHPHHHFQQHQAGHGAFVQQGQEGGMAFGQPGSFLGPPAAFVPTGKQPDWSTPQGRTSSPAPLPTYPPVQQSLPQPTQNGDAVMQYALGVNAGAYGRMPSPAPPAALQYGHQHQQQLLQQGATGVRQPQPFAPPQPPQQYFDPAAALPDDVFGEGTSQAPSTNSGSGHGGMLALGPSGPPLNGPAGPGGVARRGPRQQEGGPAGNRGQARGPRYEGGIGGMGALHQPQHMGPPPPLPPHQQQQQQQLYLMMNGFPERGPAMPYGGRGGPMPMPPRHQHMMGGGLGLRGGHSAMPPPPPEPAGSGARGGRARAGRAGRSGRGSSGGGSSGGPQPVKNMYVPKQQAAPHPPALEA